MITVSRFLTCRETIGSTPFATSSRAARLRCSSSCPVSDDAARRDPAKALGRGGECRVSKALADHVHFRCLMRERRFVTTTPAPRSRANAWPAARALRARSPAVSGVAACRRSTSSGLSYWPWSLSESGRRCRRQRHEAGPSMVGPNKTGQSSGNHIKGTTHASSRRGKPEGPRGRCQSRIRLPAARTWATAATTNTDDATRSVRCSAPRRRRRRPRARTGRDACRRGCAGGKGQLRLTHA